MEKDEPQDLLLSGFESCPNLKSGQIILEGLKLKPEVELVFFAEPATPEMQEVLTDEIFMDVLMAIDAEQNYTAMVSAKQVDAISESMNFVPSNLKLAVLFSNDQTDLDVEFCQDFPTDRFIANNTVVPIKLLLHPMGVEEMMIKVLSGTLQPHAKIRIRHLGEFCTLELQVYSYKQTRWLLTEQLTDFFEIEPFVN